MFDLMLNLSLENGDKNTMNHYMGDLANSVNLHRECFVIVPQTLAKIVSTEILSDLIQQENDYLVRIERPDIANSLISDTELKTFKEYELMYDLLYKYKSYLPKIKNIHLVYSLEVIYFNNSILIAIKQKSKGVVTI